MPSRAKLTTRGISATTVTTETLPKNAALTNNELDSNFINLRDQTFAIVGDDSTGIDIRAGDTIKFTGSGGATVTAVGNTITIGGSSTGDLTIIGSTISGPSNADINITAGGTGDINLNADTVRVGDSNANATITTNGTGSLLLNTNGGTNSGAIAITAGLNQAITLQPSGTGDVYLSTDAVVVGNSGATATITTNGSGDLVLNTNSGTSSGVIKIAWNLGGNIDITPSGTGKILLDNNYWPNTDGTNGQTLITDGAGNLSWGNATAQGITFVGDDSTGTRISDGETVKIAGGTGITTAMSGDVLTITATGGGGSTGDLTITGTTISAGTTNADITITSSGTGNLNVNMDTMRIGDANTDATITTNGTGDLTLTTNSGTNSGTIQIDQGANQNILILPNGTGKILLDDTYWPNADGTADQVLTTNGAGQLSWQTIAGELFELVGDDSTGTRIKLDDTFKIAGGTGIDTAIVGDTLTITNTGVPGPPGPSAVGITFVGDDSTGTLIADGETVKIAGAGGITTSMSGDVLTISGAQGITFVGDDSTGTRISDNETVKIAGAGSVSTAVSGDIVTITGTDTNTTYSISAETATGGANLRLTDSAAATDDVKIASGTNITVSRTDANTITIDGPTLTSYLQNVVEDTTPQLGGNLDVNGKIITSVGAGNIELQPDASGDVYLTADTVRVGDSNANATITTNGTGDLTINTNSGTNSNSIVIEDTATGRIQLIPNSTGRIDLGPVADGSATGLTNFPSAIGGNGVGVGDARIKGSGRFYSNLAYTPYTAATSQEVTAVDYTMLKTDGGSFDSANIRNSAANHFMLFDLNGGSATTTTTNSSATGVGANNNQLWYMNNAGGTKTGLNIAANRNSVNIVAGHGGALTIPRSIGYVTDLLFAANNTDTTTITEAWAFRDQGPQYSSSSSPQAVPGTNQVIGNYYAYETGLNYPTLVNNTPWAFYIRTSSQNWRSRIGAVDLPRRWSTSATHSSGGTYTINFQTTGHGFHQITLTSNITSFTMSNFPTSTAQICEIDLVFIQDGTGGRTISFTPAGTEVFKFRNGTNTLADSTAAPEVLHAKIFTRYDGSKTIYYWDIDNREYV